MQPSCNFCVNNEISLREITDSMIRQDAPSEILHLLCQYAGQPEAACQVAFFLFEDQAWTLAAQGDLSSQAQTALALIDPDRIADAIFNATVNAEGTPGHPFNDGWVRHLYSGAGELLGMMAAFHNGSLAPVDGKANRIELVARLATLTIEQAHVARELAYLGSHEAPPSLPRVAPECENPEQEVMGMIAQQSSPEEILQVLCTNIGHLEAERQIAFFLIRGGHWALAAQGTLTAASEAALARIDPETVSQQILGCDSDSSGTRESPYEGGWVRHFYSGTGELLGLIVGLRGVPAQPRGAYAARIQSACRLAALAVEQTNLMEELSFKADHDSLTGLPNRDYYERTLRSALWDSSRTQCAAALLYVDLDRFRVVNEVFGLATGDALLQQVASRLQETLRRGTTLARMGGDEFAVLIPHLTATKDAEGVAARLLASLTTPFLIDDHEIFVNASIGIGSSTPESTPESIERETYLALYEAKRAGKARAVHFDSSLAAISPERLEMEKRLRSALAKREFVVYYQPQIQFATGRVCAAEALLRWRPEGLGLVSPAAFIPILEETGLILEVGRWVLQESCRQAKEWLDTAGLKLRVAVNVSAIQLLHPGFVKQVEEALAETGFPAALLELELTESVLVGEFAAAAHVLEELQALGITLALDDFGTGQSSLSYLHRLPFHRLKIDQSFIRCIADEQEFPPIVRNIIQMAGSLGMGEVAEGVETANQAALLRQEKCELGQGFFFSRPLPANEAAAFCLGFRGEF